MRFPDRILVSLRLVTIRHLPRPKTFVYPQLAADSPQRHSDILIYSEKERWRLIEAISPSPPYPRDSDISLRDDFSIESLFIIRYISSSTSSPFRNSFLLHNIYGDNRPNDLRLLINRLQSFHFSLQYRNGSSTRLVHVFEI